jgi:hypothetical protein
MSKLVKKVWSYLVAAMSVGEMAAPEEHVFAKKWA